MEEVDRRLTERPPLRDEVTAIRAEGARRGDSWLRQEGAERLYQWQHEHPEYNQGIPGDIPLWIPRGLLGVISKGGSDYAAIQDARLWLEGKRAGVDRVDLLEMLSRRWDHETLLLNPYNGQLVETNDAERTWIADTPFGVLQFQVVLPPNEPHKLVVEYQQELGVGGLGSKQAFRGLRYILTSAGRWGGWGKTSIEIRVPQGYGRVAIRPPAGKVVDAKGMTIYQIQMGRPVENLYVSAGRAPITKKNLDK
jgi:hypothetical protein